MERLYKLLTPEDRAEFWKQFQQAVLWRGWDRSKTHGGPGGCHACEFVTFLETLGKKYGVEFEEYT